MVNTIPRFPNDHASKKQMEEAAIGNVLLDFVNWRARFVGVRPRKVLMSEDATNDPRWHENKYEIETFLDKVVCGDDLSIYLSRQTQSRGVRVSPREGGATADEKWSDKDFVLTTMGFHHFHLQPYRTKRGLGRKSNILLFAQVNRDEFLVVGLFDHSVFDRESRERARLYEINDYWSMRGVSPGAVVVHNPIATSAHSIHHVRYASHCKRIIHEIDSKLDDSGFVASFFKGTRIPVPKRPQFEWCFQHLDLGVLEHKCQVFFSLQKGWN
ncbi:MAG: hypothetical protein RH946_17540 [Rhodospirillales bacterium]